MVASPEDTVTAVDLAYPRQWARVLGVADLLKRASAEAGFSEMG